MKLSGADMPDTGLGCYIWHKMRGATRRLKPQTDNSSPSSCSSVFFSPITLSMHSTLNQLAVPPTSIGSERCASTRPAYGCCVCPVAPKLCSLWQSLLLRLLRFSTPVGHSFLPRYSWHLHTALPVSFYLGSSTSCFGASQMASTTV